MDAVRNDYLNALKFWDEGYVPKPDAEEKTITPDTDCADLAYSRQLALWIGEQLSGRTRVLDYGCGKGWAGLLLAKRGCPCVTAVEISQNAVQEALKLKKALALGDNYNALHIDEAWLSRQESGVYDGIVSTNVLDVIPPDVAENILREMARVLSPDGKVLINMNYYMEPKDNPEKNTVIRHGNHVYLNGILRMVTRTDEEWAQIFSRYFKVESCTYYAWNVEETARRRSFVLRPL